MIPDTSLAEQARAALHQHSWREAFELLSEADAKGQLLPAELDLLGEASWWVGRLPTAIDARERAYAGHVKAGENLAAAVTAVLIGRDNLFKLAIPVGVAWLNRAETVLEGMAENPAHGWLAATRAFERALAGDYEETLRQAGRAADIAERFGDHDLAAVALSTKGLSLVYKGQVDEGLAMIDEATVAAVGGELDPGVAGGVCCTTIETCAALGDWQRAGQWTEAQDRWCQREHINGFPGMCRVFRAGIKRFRGDWLEAEAEARRAVEELGGFLPAAVGLANYEIGMIQLRRGDLPAAEEALQRAHALGRDPEPGMSLLRLAQGKVDVASASIRRALDEPPTEPSWWASPDSDINRLALLPAQVEIAIAAAEVSTARAAADSLGSLADRFGSLAAKASAAAADGTVLVAEGDGAAGATALRRAIQLWAELDAPFETARARMTLADAYLADGDRDRAILELRSARAAFERLGAAPDLRRADDMLASVDAIDEARPGEARSDRALRAFVFTDIVDSTRLAELLGDEAWHRLIRWHDETLRALVAEHGGEEIKATGDGFFLAFDDTDRAIECAIAIQRRLAGQRHSQGFAPAVRIGIHLAEANRAGMDYIGSGVNQAARIGAEARGEEILVSAATLDRSRRTFGETGRRTVALKGIAVPVEIVSIDWR